MTGTDLLLIASPALLILLALVALVAAAVAIVRFDLRMTRKRAAAFRAVAGEMGLDFRPQGVSGYWADPSAFDLLQHGRARWFRNVMHGVVGGVEVCAFDYQYTTGSDRHPECRHQTAVGFRAPGLALPDFALRLRAWGDPAGPLAPALTREVRAGYRDIIFPSRAEFTRQYQLSGIDEAAVRRSFPGEILDYFAAHPALNVEAHGDRLLVYAKAVPATPEAIRGLVDVGSEILARFHPGDPADGFGADLLLIDYLQRLTAPGPHRDKRSQMNAVLDLFRRFADAGRGFLVLSSVGRQPSGRHGQNSYDGLGLASFKESGECEYSADDAFVLPPAVDGRSELRHVKARHTEAADIPLRCELEYMRFVPEQTDVPAGPGLIDAARRLWTNGHPKGGGR